MSAPVAARARSGGALAGVALAAGSALSYGVTIMVGRSLAKAGVPSGAALGARFTISGLLLFAILLVRRRGLLPAPGERLAVIGLGAIGYAVEATFFYLALGRGTAAAVALLFYAYPAIVTVLEAGLGLTRHPASVWGALVLSASGTALVVMAGSDVTITGAGVVLALCSATSFALYLLAGHRYVVRSDSFVTGAWVAGGAGLSLLVRGAVTGQLHGTSGNWDELLLTGVATASAFVLMFSALRRLGAAPVAVVMTLEAVFAIVLAAVFLDERLAPLQLLGGAAVLAATGIIGLSGARATEVTEPTDELAP